MGTLRYIRMSMHDGCRLIEMHYLGSPLGLSRPSEDYIIPIVTMPKTKVYSAFQPLNRYESFPTSRCCYYLIALFSLT